MPDRITLITRSGLNFQIPKSLQTRTRELQQDLRDPWLLPSSISHILSLATDGSANSYSEAACYDFSRINENLVTWLAKQNIKTTVFHASSGAVFGDKAIRGDSTRVDVKDAFRENRHRDAMVTATVYAHVTDQQAETASGRFANAFNA